MKSRLFILKVLWCITMIFVLFTPALSQGDPAPPLVMGQGGYPSNMIEVAPTRKTGFSTFPPGKRFVWVAVKITSVSPTGWVWKKYGPYDFKGGTRYYSHIGQIDYTVAPDYDARHSRLGRGDTALSFENIYGDKWVAIVIGNLLNSSTTGSTSHGSKYPLVLGTKLTLKEVAGSAVYDATCTRRPGTDIFDAVWGSVNVRDVITIESVNGNQITLNRQGNGGHYYGTLSADGSQVTDGTASWFAPGWYWSATVVGKNPRYPNATGTWDGSGGDCDNAGRYVVQVTTSGETFHATCSYTNHGQPYSWTMDGKIDPQGKVDAIMNHSYAGKIPAAFQLSSDGKRISGGTWNWVRR